MEQNMSKNLTMLTLGGRVQCKQCQAIAKHSRVQCKKAAMKGKAVCRTHGGASTGPRTEQGRQRCAAAKTIHGKDSREKRKQNAAASAKLNYLRDLGNLLGMFTGETGWSGRKPKAYRPPANQDLMELVRIIEALDAKRQGQSLVRP